MILTCVDLLKEFHCSAIYTFSDEITMVFPSKDGFQTPHIYGGRYSKLISLSAGFCSSKFNYHMSKQKFSETEEFVRHIL
jgi:tRNA(His) 5'-end guanylyltransferase